MAKRGIKVKELAKELGVTSREIIDRCRAEELSVQNSITKLSPEVAEVIRRSLAGDERNDPGSPSLPPSSTHSK